MKKIVSYLLSLIFYLLLGITLVLFHLLQVISFNFIGIIAQKKTVDFLNYLILKYLKILGIKIIFDNQLDLKIKKPLIIVSNHQSTYDIPPIIWYLRSYNPKFIGKKELRIGIPSISYNLRNGGSVLIDRSKPEEALRLIKLFAQRIEKNKWSAVIFPEGTRGFDGNPNKFKRKGLTTLFKNIPNATILPISINHSWKLAKNNYFPLPLGVKIHFKFHPLIYLKETTINDALDRVEKLIINGITHPNLELQ